MATYTTNLNLKKPAGTDYVLVGDFNENSNTIDAAVGKLSELTTAVKTSLVLAINEANDRGTYPPYIGENKNWYEWDSATTQYVDSGVVAEGVDGNDGISAYVHIKWSAVEPTQDSDMKSTPDAWIGIYTDANAGASTTHTDYTWYQYKGDKGDAGTAGTGNNWTAGNAITGTSTTPTAYATGITLAQVGDMYINTGALPNTGYIYKCTVGGNASTALWVYIANIRGADGAGSGDMLKSTYDTDNDGKVNAADDSDKLGGVAASGYAAAITGGATTIASSNLTASRALASDTNGKVAVSEVTATELGYVSGVTGAIQTQISGKQPSIGTASGILKGNGSGGISAATAGTDYISPVSVITDTSGSTKTIATAATNTEYRYGTLTSLTVSAFPSGNWFCRILCTAGSGLTISLPSGTRRAGGVAFSYNQGDMIQLYLDQDGATLVPFSTV